ncbi:MAG TPA: hypothetical protein VFM98_01820 [Ramlibacter sp.]|uniref:hypothetical protein n=1 Tax=Ramlibacter sp. TaxID=1917967 RepID=UPI002D7FE7F4|nr:hypothetical protein [Ramlibacter sp.]HET8744313.1 hypothetical protein [Ramlibacter sp.]
MAFTAENPNLGAFLSGIQGLARTPVQSVDSRPVFTDGQYVYTVGFDTPTIGSGENMTTGETNFGAPMWLSRVALSDVDPKTFRVKQGAPVEWLDPNTGKRTMVSHKGVESGIGTDFGSFLGAAGLAFGAAGGLSALAGNGFLGSVAGGAAGAGGAGAAGVGALDLGGGLSMAADGTILGGTGAFVPATAAEMAAMTGGELAGLGGAGLGAAGGLAGAGGGAGAAGGAAGAGGAASAASGIGGIVSKLGGWGSLLGPAATIIGGALGYAGAGQAADAMSESAAKARELLAPYVQAGNTSLGAYQDLSGANGPQKQQAAYAALQSSPQFAALAKAGEDAILQNASATGGLRGGNVQAALADKRTQLLNGLAQQQLGNLLPIVQGGQNSAAGTGSLMLQGGAAQAGGIVAGTNAITNAVGNLGGFFAGQQAAAAPPVNLNAGMGFGGSGSGFGSAIVPGFSNGGNLF